MSSFNCDHCNALCADTEFGYVTGCEHYPAEPQAIERYLINHTGDMLVTACNLSKIMKLNQHPLAKRFKLLCDELLRMNHESNSNQTS